MIEEIAHVFDHILSAAVRLFLTAMNAIENGLRGPLQTIGIHGSLQTLILMMIPVLMIVVVVKLFGGFIRLMLLLILVLVLAHVTFALFHAGVGVGD